VTATLIAKEKVVIVLPVTNGTEFRQGQFIESVLLATSSDTG